MKEAVVSIGPSVTIQDSPIPQISHPRQLIIRVVVSGSNPKDWKGPERSSGAPLNQGDDIAGLVHAVGEDITEFRVGDRVAAFHEMRAPGGSYAEYAVAWDWATFHLPKNTTFEEAATIPLAAMTSAIGVYQRLRLPHPWNKPKDPIPLVVYGAASAVGAFAIQLASLSNIHPLICIAGRGAPFVEGLIDRSKGDTIIDYRQGDDAVVKSIKNTLGGTPLYHAFDAVCEKGSYINISKVLDLHNGNIALVSPYKTFEGIPETIKQSKIMVGNVHDEFGLRAGTREFAHAFFRLFGRGLRDGWFKPHPHQVIDGGLAGVETALRNLKEGKASAVKYVFRIADTPGVAKSTL